MIFIDHLELENLDDSRSIFFYVLLPFFFLGIFSFVVLGHFQNKMSSGVFNVSVLVRIECGAWPLSVFVRKECGTH